MAFRTGRKEEHCKSTLTLATYMDISISCSRFLRIGTKRLLDWLDIQSDLLDILSKEMGLLRDREPKEHLSLVRNA